MNAKDLIEFAIKELDDGVERLARNQVAKAARDAALGFGRAVGRCPELMAMKPAAEDRVKAQIYESLKEDISVAVSQILNKYKVK
jgi:hypothetical protein